MGVFLFFSSSTFGLVSFVLNETSTREGTGRWGIGLELIFLNLIRVGRVQAGVEVFGGCSCTVSSLPMSKRM